MDTKALRQKILDLAIHGKLVPQDPNDEPASVLLERIKAEKERLIKEGKIKRSKKSAKTSDTPHYENVPFEVPEGWAWCKLGDLAFYKKGPFGSSLTKSMFVAQSDNAYKVYEQKNAIQKDHKLGSYFISKEKYESLIGFAVQPNDIIVSCAGTIGETYVLPENIREGIINQALMLIRLYYRDIERFYLLYFDFILKEEAYKESKGTAIKNIPPFDILKNFYIPLPPLAEQQRILDEVDNWMSLVDSIDSNKEHLESIIKQTKSKILDLAIHGKLLPQDPNDEPASELLKRINPKAEITCDNGHYLFDLPSSWLWCKLGDLCKIRGGKRIPKGKGFATRRTEHIYLRVTNMKNQTILLDDLKYIEDDVFEEIKNYTISSDDLYLTIAGTIGEVGEIPKEVSGMNLTENAAKLTGIICDKMYLMYSLLSSIPQEHFKSKFHQVAQPKLSIETASSTLLPLPPLDEQQRIVLKIEELFSVLDNIQKALEV